MVPHGIRAVGRGSGCLTRCVELDELERHFADRSPHPSPRLLPLSGAKASQRRIDATAGIADDAVGLIDRNIESVALGIVDVEVLAFYSTGLETDQTAEHANPVIDVHDVVAGRQCGRKWTRFGMAAAVCAPGLLAKSKDLEVSQKDELRLRSGPAAVEVRRPDLECAGCKRQRRGSGVAQPVPTWKDVL